MSETLVSAAYKKKEGSLLLSADQTLLTWTSAGASVPTVSIPVPRIANLQATPATAAKVMIKVFSLPEGISTPTPEVQNDVAIFSFNSSQARQDCDTMKDALTTAIQAAKTAAAATAQGLGTSVPGAGNGAGASAGAGSTMAIASALASGKATADGAGVDKLSKAELVGDLELQEALLKSNTDLQRTFHETVIMGDGSIKPLQFWSTRVHLLRSFAIERSQKRGPYNVLATIKPKTVDNVVKMSLTRDQIAEIFEQHPLVRRVYDENVPKLSEDMFWKKFFQSRLCKKLRGERILQQDPWDEVLDKYLDFDDDANIRKKAAQLPIPNQISLAGNTQNITFRGNRPDITMRPENPPIIKTLNSLSLKFVDSVTPADADPTQTLTILSDLAPPEPEDAIPLPILHPNFAQGGTSEKRTEVTGEILEGLKRDLGANVDLSTSYSTSHSTPALHQITQTLLSKSPRSKAPPDPVPAAVSVHATTLEFLRHFYDAFLSGDSKRVGEAEKLVGSLRRARERILEVERVEKERVAREREEREREGKKRRRREERGAEVGLEGLREGVERAVRWWEEINPPVKAKA